MYLYVEYYILVLGEFQLNSTIRILILICFYFTVFVDLPQIVRRFVTRRLRSKRVGQIDGN